MTKLLRKLFYGLKINKLSLFLWSCFYRKKERVLNTNNDLFNLSDICSNKARSCIHNNNVKSCADCDLTIIVPAYNAEKFIENCINSILVQKTKFSYKVIIINDGSIDGTLSKLSRFVDIPNIEVISQENKGHSGARNTGLHNICSKYVMFLDSDDALSDNCIEVLLSKAFEGNYDIVQGDYETVYNGKVINTFHNSGLCGYPWGKVYKASLFEKLQFPEGVWFEDSIVEFILKDMAASVGFVNDVVYLYSDNPEGITNNCLGKPKVLDSWYVTELLFNDRIKLGLENTPASLEVLLKQMLINNWRIKSLNSEDLLKTVFYKECNLVNQVCIDNSLSDYRLKLLLKIARNSDYNGFRLFLRLY